MDGVAAGGGASGIDGREAFGALDDDGDGEEGAARARLRVSMVDGDDEGEYARDCENQCVPRGSFWPIRGSER